MSQDIKQILVNEDHKIFDITGMFFKEFPSDFRQIRYFTLLIIQKAPPEIKEINLLEQQISEIIKNAIKHGNKSDIKKKIRIWYQFTNASAKVIVEDEGDGFKKIEEWNAFNRKRQEAFYNQDFEKLSEYVSYRTIESEENDGGNALFASVEYWNGGVVFSARRNKIGVLKTFAQKRHGINL